VCSASQRRSDVGEGTLEQQAVDRGLHRLCLGVEPDNPRARRLYEHPGYRAIGESDASWEAEAADGTRYLYSTTFIEMERRASAL